jgi:hypothetical protein
MLLKKELPVQYIRVSECFEQIFYSLMFKNDWNFNEIFLERCAMNGFSWKKCFASVCIAQGDRWMARCDWTIPKRKFFELLLGKIQHWMIGLVEIQKSKSWKGPEIWLSAVIQVTWGPEHQDGLRCAHLSRAGIHDQFENLSPHSWSIWKLKPAFMINLKT